jgi:DNA-3-methyladenine glycosylase II
MTTAQEIKHAEDQLIRKDRVLGRLIQLQRPISIEPRGDYFYSLCRSIISQQLSVASAAAIFDRLQTATDLNPQAIVQLSDEEFRSIGLSRQKTAYIKDLAGHFVNNPKVYEHLYKLTDEAVVEELTKVKGVGVWTAEMFLMFTLSRIDVFAPDDVGLQRAMKTLYGWDQLPQRTELIEFAERWRPYRTIACRHLWKSLHNTPE